MCRSPSASASISKLALWDSISARPSPFCTWSPSCFFHSRTVPSSIVSESLGMLTSDIYVLLESLDRGRRLLLAHHFQGPPDDVVHRRDRLALQVLRVRHWHLGAAQPGDRR